MPYNRKKSFIRKITIKKIIKKYLEKKRILVKPNSRDSETLYKILGNQQNKYVNVKKDFKMNS